VVVREAAGVAAVCTLEQGKPHELWLHQLHQPPMSSPPQPGNTAAR
jgi:hypothetical protein